jgi:adenylate cyclase
VLTADARRDERFEAAQSLYQSDVRSLMCAPLGGNASATSIIGLLYVDNSWNHQFSVADLELFTALADYASVAVSQARLGEQLKQEARRRERLSRYHSPAVVDLVLQDDRASESILGQERDVTILFADIVQFTTLSEEIAADEVVRILNAFFGAMTNIVFEHQGTVDKFIGDAILVVFGAPLYQSDHAVRAVETARAMQAAVQDLNLQHLAPRPLRVRIAVHSGAAIVGDVGSPQRLEYTVVGDVVNTAARLQSEVAAPDQVVVSRATLDRMPTPPAVEPIGFIKVRGRAASVEAFRLLTD